MAFAKINGTELVYVESGNGLPCLVMHGGLGVDHTQFREWLDPLGDALHLIYYDHRGNGRSGRPPIETLTFEQLVADADALRANLGHEEVAVLGHSYGGCLALLYALHCPQRVSHLVLVGTTAGWDYWVEMAVELQRREVAGEVASALVNLPVTDEEMARNQLAIAPLAFHPANLALASRVLSRTRWNAAANVRSRELAPLYNVRSRLHEISAPTLILTGREDFFCPPMQAERLHEGIARSSLVIFERSGHYPFAEQSPAFQAAVRSWLHAVTEPQRRVSDRS
jgi:proline iminopeptidase